VVNVPDAVFQRLIRTAGRLACVRSSCGTRSSFLLRDPRSFGPSTALAKTIREAGDVDGGLDLDLLAAADARIQGLPELRNTESLVVVHGGEVAFERYYRGRSAEDLADTHSVTKSFTSAVVGALVSDRTLDLDAPVASLLHAPVRSDVARREVTVRHLLTMTSGLPADGRWELCEVALHGGSWIETMLGAPLRSAPGAEYAYNNGAVHLLSAVVREVVGTSLGTVAAQRLLGPLGVDRYEWPADPDGHEIPSGHLLMTPRNMAKLGLLFLRHGEWNAAHLIDPGYVDEATARQAPGRPVPEGVGYGYLWWVDDLACPPAFFAGGHGGQYIYVVPAFDLVVVTTADAYAEPRPFGRALRTLIESYVVRAVRS
jgi:CubicO group peptidase (beta-lactamase class C family)